MPEPGRGEVERRLPVGERAHDARTPSDFAQDALERIVGADAPPVLLREGVVGERLLDRRLDEVGSPGQPQRAQLLDHSDDLFACGHDVLARVDRLEHRRDLPHLGRGHVAEDVAVPVHDAALPGGLGEELGGTLGKPQAGVRDDQPDTAQTALLEMTKERAPARLPPWLPRRCRESPDNPRRSRRSPPEATRCVPRQPSCA